MRTYHPDSFRGVLNSKCTVYQDPKAKDGELLVGYKDTSPYDAGFFYAPYIPLQVMDDANKETFKPKIAFKTRYDKKEEVTQSRKLKARWSLEAAEDLRSLHGLDAEAELTNILAAEILKEINRECIITIYGLAQQPEAELNISCENENEWQFVEIEPSTEQPTIYTPFIVDEEAPTPHISFNNSEWFGILGEKNDYGLMVGRREETSDVHGLRIALDVGEDG